jgi:hypothetical protein
MLPPEYVHEAGPELSVCSTYAVQVETPSVQLLADAERVIENVWLANASDTGSTASAAPAIRTNSALRNMTCVPPL